MVNRAIGARTMAPGPIAPAAAAFRNSRVLFIAATLSAFSGDTLTIDTRRPDKSRGTVGLFAQRARTSHGRLLLLHTRALLAPRPVPSAFFKVHTGHPPGGRLGNSH